MWHAGFQTSFFVNSFINAAVWCAAVGKGAAREHKSADSGGSRLHSGHYAMGSPRDCIAEPPGRTCSLWRGAEFRVSRFWPVACMYGQFFLPGLIQ
jgi:hypothetical protein